EPPGGWPPEIQAIILKGATPKIGRPGEHLAAVDLEATKAEVEEKVGHPISRTDLMSYLMYPEVFLNFESARQAWSDVSVLPTAVFYYGMERGDEITVEIEKGKSLIVKFLTVGEPHPDGTRTIFYELNGQPREVTVFDKSLKSEVRQRIKADPSNTGHAGAPIPGAITSVLAILGMKVKRGDRLLVMEAMKMQTTVYSPIEGEVKEVLVEAGQTVETKDLLVVVG
ncbi:MAG: pyruvate carboxylase, partial [Bryobacteraceae bacterium]|nr:pyruvate carboxylase [Bryobacteraceae bacterium]